MNIAPLRRPQPRRTLAAMLVASVALFAVIANGCGGGDDKKSETFPTTASGAPATAAPGGSVGTPVTVATERMVLAREQKLVLRNDKGNERVLVQTPANTFPAYPVWSPNGAQIAYVQSTVFTGVPGQDWGGDIYLVDAVGGKPKLVWKHDQPGAQVQGLAWLPDGTSLLIGYYLTLIKDGRFAGQTQYLATLDVAGGTLTKTVENGMFPSLSKDATKLSYMTQDIDGKGGIWMAAPDGSGAKQVAELGATFLAILYPRISPDGSTVVFASIAGKSGAEHGFGESGLNALHGLPMDVFKVDASGSSKRLTTLSEDEPFAVWSPDGKGLNVCATGGLYEVAPDGTNTKKVGQGSFGCQIDVR